jgi:hypothetical protein
MDDILVLKNTRVCGRKKEEWKVENLSCFVLICFVCVLVGGGAWGDIVLVGNSLSPHSLFYLFSFVIVFFFLYFYPIDLV